MNIKEILKNRKDINLKHSTDTHNNLYRHFKGKWYEFIGISKHTETGEETVTYKALYNCPEKNINFGDLFNRPVEMFFSKTDKEKYSDAEQEYRLMNYYELIKAFGEIKVNKMLKDLEYNF